MTGKRRVKVVMVLALVLSFAGMAFAEQGQLELRYTHTAKIVASLKISGNKAMAAGSITPSGKYDTKITVRLQRGKNNQWITIATWNGSGKAGSAEAGGTKVLPKGYDYRAKVTGYVYDASGKLVETVTKYSSTKSY